jgi:polyhydroxybutyrate depolymerase
MKKTFWLINSAWTTIVVIACMTTSTLATQPAPSQPSVQLTVTVQPATQAAPPPIVMKPGNYKQSINLGGTMRTYILHVPTGYDGSEPLPLVFVLHGFGGSAANMVKLTGMDGKADEQNFFVAYINGTPAEDSALGWNSGLLPDLPPHVDDVAFVRELLKQLEQHLSVDPRRVYAAGFSNGGFMTHRLAAELPDLLAGAAVVEGTMGLAQPDGSFATTTTPAGPIAVVIIHGKADPNVLYNGGGPAPGGHHMTAKSVEDAVAFWTQADDCTGTPQETTSNDGNVIKTDYTSCAAGSEVLLYTIVNGKHEWPTLEGPTKFSATDAIWEFFSQHP